MIFALALASGAILGYFLFYVPDDGGGDGTLPTAMVTFHALTGDFIFDVDVANTAESRSRGLMHVESMHEDSGMLFEYSSPDNITFWMKNTLISLDIIFIDENFTVINIAEADPEPGVADGDLTLYSSRRDAKYAVEINQGLSQVYGIVPGSTMEINYPV